MGQLYSVARVAPYLLIALHQLKSLAFNVVFATDHVGEDWG